MSTTSSENRFARFGILLQAAAEFGRMRGSVVSRVGLAGLFLALGVAASAAQVTTAPVRPGAKPPEDAPVLRRRTASPENAEARRAETERQKRWDDRMRRATRSMCDRC